MKPFASRLDSIFVQIASYRDPELLPTLVDLIGRCARPERLRIVVCWQHAGDESLVPFWQRGFTNWRAQRDGRWNLHLLDFRGASIELIDVPHIATEGACWARNLIQQRYRGERYTLQLDSHHRFVEHWDALLTDMLESLRNESAKPVLTTYLPSYYPDDREPPSNSAPQFMSFARFSEAGIALFRPKPLNDWQTLRRPVRARFYSAHFAFADGHFADTVQHDPRYFFHGEEISIAVRAFTHGYDLFHPHRVLAWHEYTRRQRAKVWTDHTASAQRQGQVAQPWTERNDRAMRRHRALFGTDGHPTDAARFDRYGFGLERTVAAYEAYAGLCFARRGVDRAVLDDRPPAPEAALGASDHERQASSMLRSNTVRIYERSDAFAASGTGNGPLLTTAASIRISVRDAAGFELHRAVLDQPRLASHRNDERLDFEAVFVSALERIPERYVVELIDDAGELMGRVESAYRVR